MFSSISSEEGVRAFVLFSSKMQEDMKLSSKGEKQAAEMKYMSPIYL